MLLYDELLQREIDQTLNLVLHWAPGSCIDTRCSFCPAYPIGYQYPMGRSS